MSKLLLIAAPLIAVTAVAAHAQAPAPAQPSTQQPPTRAEVVQKLDEGFNRVDTNNDGFLDRNEINAAGAKAVADAQENLDEKVREEFNKLDADKSGQLSLTEFKAAAKVSAKASPDQALQRLDTNKDGKITPDEAAKAKGR